MTENLVSGKKYRILIDEANDIWDRISFWTKAADVYYNDNTSAEANKPVNMLKRSSAYTVGTIAYVAEAPSWVMLKCTTAGTTAATVPSTYSTISSVGTVITDGTAKFTVYDARPNATLSTSAYQIPAMSLVNGLNSELTANGKKFYFDYQNSKYGYNTSANRSSSTFVPFGGTGVAAYLVEAYYGGFTKYTPASYDGKSLPTTTSAFSVATPFTVNVNGYFTVAYDGDAWKQYSNDNLVITILKSCHMIGTIASDTTYNIDSDYSTGAKLQYKGNLSSALGLCYFDQVELLAF